MQIKQWGCANKARWGSNTYGYLERDASYLLVLLVLLLAQTAISCSLVVPRTSISPYGDG